MAFVEQCDLGRKRSHFHRRNLRRLYYNNHWPNHWSMFGRTSALQKIGKVLLPVENLVIFFRVFALEKQSPFPGLL